MEAVEALRGLWATSADPQLAVQLQAAVDELSVKVDTHMGDEERTVVPLICGHLTDDEWAQCVERGADYLPKINVRLALAFIGLVLPDCPPAEQRLFLAGIPAPARVLWRLFGKRTFASYRSNLSGPASRRSHQMR